MTSYCPEPGSLDNGSRDNVSVKLIDMVESR
jgi:hypothetical protein